jgi:hypothetical protein
MPKIDLQVSASADDGNEEGATTICWIIGTEQLHRSGNALPNSDYTAHRWSSALLPPQDSVITAAYIEIYVKTTDSDDMDGEWYFEKAGSPAQFTNNNADITSRIFTTAHVNWEESSLGTGWKQSPSLVTSLQEVIDNYSPTALVAIFKPIVEGTVRECISYAWNATPGLSAKLHIEWVRRTGPLPMHFRS